MDHSVRSKVIEAPCGPVTGVLTGHAWRFRAIPFARPPVGDLRFKPPVPVAPWREPRAAMNWAAPPMQMPSIPPVTSRDAPAPSEDCLYLNVWSPVEPGDYPVFVWVHGGANIAGSSSMPVFDGANFAARGIVCVTLTYRVGAFGFLELGDVLGPDYANSALNGLRDIAAALAWVATNIRAFGGNPEQITLGGQSAGAKNIAALLASTIPHAPIARAILQSGGGQTVASRDEAQVLTQHVLDELGIDPADSARLLNLPAEMWIRAQTEVVGRYPTKFPFRPVFGNAVLPVTPLAAFRQGRARNVALLLGSTRDESPVGGPAMPRDETVGGHQLANMPLDAFLGIQSRYASVYPDLAPEQRKYRALSAEEYGIPSMRLAEAQVANGGDAWMYRFDMPSTHGHSAGFCRHGSELALTWNALDDPDASHLGPDDAAAVALGRSMHEAWVRFIVAGDPATPDLGWPRFDLDQRIRMRFSAQPGAIADPDRAERLVWRDWPEPADTNGGDIR